VSGRVRGHGPAATGGDAGGVRVGLRYFDGCPSWRVAEDRLLQVLSELGRPHPTIARERVESRTRALELDFRGSPTVLIDGVDPFLDQAAPVGLSCRLYRTDEGTDGAPSLAQLRAVFRDRCPGTTMPS
jgi:hypothetical protein